MNYFDEATDNALVQRITTLLPRIYFKGISKQMLTIQPHQVYSLKADKVIAPACSSVDIDSADPGMFIIDKVLVSNAGMDQQVEAITKLTVDQDIMDKLCRIFLYLSMGDSTNVFTLITEVSQETKNVIQENNDQVRKQPVRTSGITAWQL